ncbi:MAG: hypothetical protein V4735_00155 [Pseudomonadota bacterium]
MKKPATHIPFTRAHWLGKVKRSLLIAAIMVSTSLTIGILGYHYLGALPWVDALLEASMILGGMGPVSPMQNDAVKIFASAYALFSGLALVSTTGMLLAPWLQRMLYHTHRQAHCDAVIAQKD